MPQIAEIVKLPDGRLAVVVPMPTSDEGSITLWTEEERESALKREREAAAEIAFREVCVRSGGVAARNVRKAILTSSTDVTEEDLWGCRREDE